MLSCIAALQAPVIVMCQNRQAIKDQPQADQNFQINISPSWRSSRFAASSTSFAPV
jgi:uncharacterized membrane protein